VADLDLTEAIEAGLEAVLAEVNGEGSRLIAGLYAPTAVRAAAPIIERAVREAHGRHFSFGCVKCQSGARDAGWIAPAAEVGGVAGYTDRAVNVVLTFEDQDGREWIAAAVMTPLERFGETCDVADMPDRAFVLKGFKVVTDGG
jgi:hypothetical protein